MATKKEQVWVIVEFDDDHIVPTVHQQSIDNYDTAFAEAMKLAKKYRDETKLNGEITSNEDDGRIEVEVLSQYHHFSVQAVDLPQTKAKKSKKKKHPVLVICYGHASNYDDADIAIKEYEEAVRGCDPSSSECARYNYILTRLRAGATRIDDRFA